MPNPWFERWGWIGYKPIHRNGTILLFSMISGFAILAALSMYFIDYNGVLSSILGILAAITGLVGHYFIFIRMRD